VGERRRERERDKESVTKVLDENERGEKRCRSKIAAANWQVSTPLRWSEIWTV
jgi:hypothetical protein